MKRIFARSHYGAQDLFMGVPNLDGAVLSKVIRDEGSVDYITNLVFTLKDQSTFIVTIMQEKR